MKKSQIFNEVPMQKVSKNLFDLSHEVKMSGKFGLLYPVLCLDAVPGDTIRDTMTAFVRFAPMLAPVMHRIDVTTHFFFVPNRILSDHWDAFITGGQNGTSAPILPYIRPDTIEGTVGDDSKMAVGSLWDYLGLPPHIGAPPAVSYSDEEISVLPFRAYAKIWNDYYRDPNLDNEAELNVALAGQVSTESLTANLLNLRNRMWEKDYFTSALPWAQRGAEVLMPLSGTGTVTYSPYSSLVRTDGGAMISGDPLQNQDVGLEDRLSVMTSSTRHDARIENIAGVDISTSDVSINDLRRSIAIQRWLENNARGGGRYIEQIQSHFGVRVPDYRLQRAEYLGGGKQPVVISEVRATAESDEVVVGDMKGHGISVGKSNRFTYRCQEHGWVIGIMSVVPRTAYSQGIDRMWTRKSKFDFAWPELAHLGEQEILSKELFFSYDHADDDDNQNVFGYIPRYAEYKFKNDRIAGDFRTSLAFWHLSRNFVTRPVLDSSFTTMYENNTAEEETYRRIFAVEDGTDYLWMQLFHRLTAKRPLPYFGVPSL